MNTAVIGLIGVIVGAVLAGAVNLALDRRRRLARARVAGRLIGVELGVAEAKVTSALTVAKAVSEVTNRSNVPKSGDTASVDQDSLFPADGSQRIAAVTEQLPAVDTAGWWMGNLPTDAWKKHQSHLATNVNPNLLEMVAEAYALCVVLNDEHAEAKLSGARPRGNLADDVGALALARTQLADESKIKPRKARQRVVRWSPALAVTVAVIVLAIFALFAPRVDVNSATVTTALQSQLGHSMLVQCNPNFNGDWDCTAYPQSWSTPSSASTASFRQAVAADYALATPSLASSTSISTLQPIAFAANVDGTEVDAALVEESGHVDRVRGFAAKLSTSNALKRIWRSIVG